MEERQVTVDGKTHFLPRPFFVMATQNPIELEGTFPLPEAQLDRFLLRIRLGYPEQNEEIAILERFQDEDPLARTFIRCYSLRNLSICSKRVKRYTSPRR